MKCLYLKQYLTWVFWSIVSCAIYSQAASAASPGELIPLESASSPASVTAIEKSSVWLNWAYEYGGDLGHTVVYKEQVIGFTSASNPTFQPLAKRVGQNGVIKIVPAQPASLYGRVEMISANSTLAIHNIQHSDSSYSFSSYITFFRDLGGATVVHSVDLKPTVRITIQGKTSAHISPTSVKTWHESTTSFALHASPDKSTVTGVVPSESTTWYKSPSSTSSSLHTPTTPSAVSVIAPSGTTTWYHLNKRTSKSVTTLLGSSTSSSLHSTTTMQAVTVIAHTKTTAWHKSSTSVTTLHGSSRTTVTWNESSPKIASRHIFPTSAVILKPGSQKDKTWLHKVVIASVVMIIVLVIAFAILIAILYIKRRKAKFVAANKRQEEEIEMQLHNPGALWQTNLGEKGVPNLNGQNQDNSVNLHPKQSNDKNKTKLANSKEKNLALVIENKNHITNNDFQRQSEQMPWVYQDMSGPNVATRPAAVSGTQQEENIYEEIKE